LLKLFKYYLDNNLISQNTRKSIENELNLTYTWLLSRYNREELSEKLNKADMLYKKGNLNKETIKNIFPEYWTKIEMNLGLYKIYMLLMLLVVWWALWISAYSEIKEWVLQDN